MNHLAAMRVSDTRGKGEAAGGEESCPVGAVRLFEGSSDDGEKGREQKNTHTHTQAPTAMEGFQGSALIKRKICHQILMVFFHSHPPSLPLSSVFFQSCWAPPRDSTSTTKTQTGKTSVCVYVLVCVSAGEISTKLSQKNAMEESLCLD